MQKIKNSEIILKGLLWVNIPVLIIIFGGTFLLFCTTDWSFNKCILVGAALGWIYWEFAVSKWINWALDKEVEEDNLFKLGQKSFLLWNRAKIHKASSNKKKTT